MSKIHPTAIVSPKAELADDVTVGPHTIIEENVVVDSGTTIGSSVVLASGARLGKNVKVFHSAVIGTVPQDLKFGGEETTAEIGDNTVIREFVTFNRGTKYHKRTEIGRDSLMMAYSHAAHDCLIGNNVIMANSVNLAGHIEIGDYAILGGVLPVHQFVRIGAHSMIGGGFRVQQDVCPYSLVGGYPLRVVGINSVGLKRRDFDADVIRALERVFKVIFFSKLNTTQALTRVKDEVELIPEVKLLLDFFEASERGVIK